MKKVEERILKFEQQLNITMQIQKGVLDMIQANARSIREQQRQLSDYARLSAQLTWASSYIQARIVYASGDLRTFGDEMSHHRVATRELADLLSLTEISHIDPQDTRFISISGITSNTVQFKFNVITRSRDTFIYKLLPFRVWDNLLDMPRLMEYHGHRFVVYNKC